MKRILTCAWIFTIISYTSIAQTKAKPKTTKAQTAASSTKIIRQVNSSSNDAKRPAIPRSNHGWLNTPVVSNDFQIADPVLRTLNARANGANTPIDYREFMGIGRGTYGIANGQLLLRPNGTTTSGGITGSGAVGTGSTPGGVGVHGNALGVNGKNPYAGPGMWGTTGTGIGTNFRMSEKSSRPIRLKKEDKD